MSHRLPRLLLGSSAAALAAVAVTAGVAHSAAPSPARTVSHWFTQTEPAKNQAVFVRNGTTPATGGPYRIAIRVTSAHDALTCFAERAGGTDLGKPKNVAAGDRKPYTVAASAPAGTRYNLICLGTGAGKRVIGGTVTESTR